MTKEQIKTVVVEKANRWQNPARIGLALGLGFMLGKADLPKVGITLDGNQLGGTPVSDTVTGLPARGGAAPEVTVEPTVAPTVEPSPEVEAEKYVSLNYDESNGDALTPGQENIVAKYLRDAEAAGVTQAAMETAIGFIQQEAARVGATVFEGKELTLDQHQAWLVWCSDATGANVPTDASVIFDQLPQGPGNAWIQIIFDQRVPVRGDNTFKGCNGTFWAVAVK